VSSLLAGPTSTAGISIPGRDIQGTDVGVLPHKSVDGSLQGDSVCVDFVPKRYYSQQTAEATELASSLGAVGKALRM